MAVEASGRVPDASRGSAIAWSWRNAAHGALLAAPAVVGTVVDPGTGLPLAVGVLPAAALGLRGTRRARASVLLVGALAGISMFLGSLVAPWPVVAVIVLFALCVLVATLVAHPQRRFAPLAMMLGLPLFGAGLSEPSASAGLSVALLMIGGSVYAWLVSLPWPSTVEPPRAERPAPPRSAMIRYGIQIGLAGSAAAAIGYALGADHPGWPATAALLVSRPDRKVLDARGWQRSIAVLAGAVLACTVAAIHPGSTVLAALMLLTLVGAAGTSGSRFYVMPFFSTTIVLTMLIHDETQPASHWFLERVALTILGAALALAAGWIVPRVGRRGLRTDG